MGVQGTQLQNLESTIGPSYDHEALSRLEGQVKQLTEVQSKNVRGCMQISSTSVHEHMQEVSGCALSCAESVKGNVERLCTYHLFHLVPLDTIASVWLLDGLSLRCCLIEGVSSVCWLGAHDAALLLGAQLNSSTQLLVRSQELEAEVLQLHERVAQLKGENDKLSKKAEHLQVRACSLLQPRYKGVGER